MDKKSTVQRITEDLALKLRTEFVQGIELESGERQYLPIIELATKYNVAQTSLFRLSQRENWRDQKEQFKLQLQAKIDEETAKQMAEKVRKMFSSKLGLSITGIAGPDGGSNKKPIGLTYIGLSTKNETKVRKFQFGLIRKSNKARATQAALNWIRLEISNV